MDHRLIKITTCDTSLKNTEWTYRSLLTVTVENPDLVSGYITSTECQNESTDVSDQCNELCDFTGQCKEYLLDNETEPWTCRWRCNYKCNDPDYLLQDEYEIAEAFCNSTTGNSTVFDDKTVKADWVEEECDDICDHKCDIMDNDGLFWAWPLDGSVSDKPEGAVTIQACRFRCMSRCFRIGSLDIKRLINKN